MSVTIPTPSPAATVVLLRDRAAARGVEVFMVRRHHQAAFMANAYVFPGGRVDAADAAAGASRWCNGVEEAAARFQDLDPEDAVAHHVAAVRELFEEAGVLLARATDGRFVAMADEARRARFDACRRSIHGGAETLRAVVEREGLRLALDALVPFAHWITPAIESRRFDARFFVAPMPADQEPLHDAAETTDSLWVAPEEAIARERRLELILAPPTWRILADLAAFETAAAVLAWARTQSMAPILPQLVEEHGTSMLVLPGDPLFASRPETSPIGGPGRSALQENGGPQGPALQQKNGQQKSVTRFVREHDRWRPMGIA